MDEGELDDVLLLHRGLHDRHLRREAVHADPAQIRTEGAIVHVERVLGRVLRVGRLPQCS